MFLTCLVFLRRLPVRSSRVSPRVLSVFLSRGGPLASHLRAVLFLRTKARQGVLQYFRTIFGSSSIIVMGLILIYQMYVFTTCLPRRQVRFVFVSIFLRVVRGLSLVTIYLRVYPCVPISQGGCFAFRVFYRTGSVSEYRLVLRASEVFSG